MSDVITMKELTYADDNWHLVAPFEDPKTALTIKNAGGTTVSIYKTKATELTEDTLATYIEANSIDPLEIGGVLYELSSEYGDKVFVRCTEGSGKIAARIYGTLDPTADVETIGRRTSELSIAIEDHLNTVSGNPHHVTKAEVGLGNIPNAISSDPDTLTITTAQGNNVVASLEAVRVVKRYAREHIVRTDNPHYVTKEQINLGLVENYPIANDIQAVDRTNNETYMTPYTTSLLLNDYMVITLSVLPQTVIKGAIRGRPAGWMATDISPVPAYVVKADTKLVKVLRGLQVSYAYFGSSRLSKVLEEDLEVNFPNVTANGIYYIYVDLNSVGEITTAGYTADAPSVQMTDDENEVVTGDYYNAADCVMKNNRRETIFRVYVGRVYCRLNELIDVTSVPFGTECVIPVENTLNLGRSLLIENPFIMPVDTVALVEYNGRWGETKWNDQTGVIASPRPGYSLNEIVVQAGSVGFLTKGSSSGTGFSGDFETITTPLRVAVRVRRRF